MRFLLVFILLLLCFLSTQGKKAKKPGKGKKGKSSTCQRSITLDELEKGLKATCSAGLLARVNIVGISNNCRGLTPDLFVQELKCHWNNSCSLTYKREGATNILLKLKYDNPHEALDNGQCFLRSPESFIAEFNCTKGVEVFDIVQEDAARKVTNQTRGLIRSHSEHPWLYKRSDHNLTLSSPGNKTMNFVYTFWNFHLWQTDSLNVSWTEAGKTKFELYNDTFFLTPNLHNNTRMISAVNNVTFTFGAFGSNGGGGFVICFAWAEGKLKQDACMDIMEPANCSSPKRKNPGQKAPRPSSQSGKPKKNKKS